MEVVGDGLVITAVDEVESRVMTDLGEVARFIRDRSGAISVVQARELGVAVGLLAAIDKEVVWWPNDKEALRKLVDAYYFLIEAPEQSHAFGEGLREVMRDLAVLDYPPRDEHLRMYLQPEPLAASSGPGEGPRMTKSQNESHFETSRVVLARQARGAATRAL